MPSSRSIALNLLAVRDIEPVGIERFVRNVAGRLRFPDARSLLFLRSGVTPRAALGPEYVDAHPRLLRTQYRVGPTWLRILLEMFWLSWVCRDVDVVFSVNNFGPLWGKKGQKRAVVIHDVWFMSDVYDGSSLSRHIFKWLLCIQIPRSSLILTVSDFSRREISKYFNVEDDKIRVVGNCLSDFDEADAWETEVVQNPYALLVGSDRKNKNVWRALLAYREYVSRASTPLSLVIVGSYSDQYKNMVRDTFGDLGALLQLEGYVASGRYSSLVAGCDGVIFPSLYEGYGIPVMEAVCAKKPVLVAENTVCAELAGAVAVIVDGLDIQSIAAGIHALQKNDPVVAEPLMTELRDQCTDCDIPAGKLQQALRLLLDNEEGKAA